MSSKLLNTTNANLISFPSISLFPHSPNYIHIYFLINAISFSQNLKITSTYSINNSQNDILIDDKSTKTHYLSNLMKEIKTSLK
ncbi:unnamed protein product [Rotaria sordida]|uniref:Uncharacterized protein n=1 Tax=Rotaria sordida TaxID=392033 RepID=A0A815B1R5_9BILA|nr:unnamed protein product [Rotaria sordida]CAF1547336.1 unnamed protein product [Rotaria sordida]